jgi:thiol-disulfide isomerase/thioredoxin
MKPCLLAKQIFFVICLLTQFKLSANSQTLQKTYPGIGDRCPDFILDNLSYYSKTKASRQDFDGKPIILSFFSTGCGSSFESLPHLKEMQKQFEGQVQFILIGRSDAELKSEYEKYRSHYQLTFPVDFDDSVLWNKFGVYFVAHTIWIDGSGIIRQITTPYALTPDRIEKLIAGQQQNLVISSTLGDHDDYMNGIMFYDPEKPFLVAGNGGADTSFSYRSIFSLWDYRTGYNFDNFISSKNNNTLFESGVSLRTLYNLAYGDTVQFQTYLFTYGMKAMEKNTYSKWSNTPDLVTKRKDIFKADYYTGENLFTYSLNVPKRLGNAKSLQAILRRELKNYFGFNVTVETRMRPCWKLIVDPKKKDLLKTKGETPVWKGGFSQLTLKNMPVTTLISTIWGFNQDGDTIIDETRINGNIDIDIDCIWTDLNDVKKELREKGLDLVRSEKMLKVLVIRD